MKDNYANRGGEAIEKPTGQKSKFFLQIILNFTPKLLSSILRKLFAGGLSQC